MVVGSSIGVMISIMDSVLNIKFMIKSIIDINRMNVKGVFMVWLMNIEMFCGIW